MLRLKCTGAFQGMFLRLSHMESLRVFTAVLKLYSDMRGEVFIIKVMEEKVGQCNNARLELQMMLLQHWCVSSAMNLQRTTKKRVRN